MQKEMLLIKSLETFELKVSDAFEWHLAPFDRFGRPVSRSGYKRLSKFGLVLS